MYICIYECNVIDYITYTYIYVFMNVIDVRVPVWLSGRALRQKRKRL